MKRLIVAILFALSTLFAVPSVSASVTPTCPGSPEFRGYGSNNELQLLGIQCAQSSTLGYDDDFGDNWEGFRGTDNNAMNSFRFLNPTNDVWCVRLYDAKDFDGTSIVYAFPGNAVWVLQSGSLGTWSNRVSSMEMYKRTNGAC